MLHLSQLRVIYKPIYYKERQWMLSIRSGQALNECSVIGVIIAVCILCSISMESNDPSTGYILLESIWSITVSVILKLADV